MPVISVRRIAAVLIFCSVAAPVAAQMSGHDEHPAPKNLKVLPKDISHDELIGIMRSFTDALGVRCTYCHVGEEGKPMNADDFAKDDKPAKEVARAMMRMTTDVNQKVAAAFAGGTETPTQVRCFTCHHGAREPRTLQDVLQKAYDGGGVDSTVARYNALRDRYYGRATYDFGDGPLNEVAQGLSRGGHPDDAMRLLQLNADMNPKSMSAQRQLTVARVLQAYRQEPAAGHAAVRAARESLGERMAGEEMQLMIAHQLGMTGNATAALEALKDNVGDHPGSTRALSALAEMQAAQGDKKGALKTMQQALKIAPDDADLKTQLAEIKSGPAKPKH